MVQRTSTPKAALTFCDGILIIKFIDDTELELADVKLVYELGLEMSGGVPYCCLADVRNNIMSTPEARAFGAEKGYSQYRLADAILVDSAMMKLVANIYINFNKPKVPTRMFQSEEKAIDWLKSFLIKKD